MASSEVKTGVKESIGIVRLKGEILTASRNNRLAATLSSTEPRPGTQDPVSCTPRPNLPSIWTFAEAVEALRPATSASANLLPSRWSKE